MTEPLTAQEQLVASMRAVADTLELFNALYQYGIEEGQWSPKTLRYEADYLEANP
jgi:hypothetical protein